MKIYISTSAKLSASQIEELTPIFKNSNIKKAAKRIVFYRSKVPSLARFRLDAETKIHEILEDHGLNKRRIRNQEYWATWLSDGAGGLGDYFRNFVTVLEKETGRKVKF